MISIIGGGPCGNYLAYQLAERGVKVSVFEEHGAIGRPIQCTGITTLYLRDILELDERFLVNTIDTTRVFGPNGEFIEIPLKDNYIVDRCAFDGYLGAMAEDAGATFHLGKRFTGFKKDDSGFVLGFQDGSTARSERLVGADGPGSMVARAAGMYGKRKLVVGMQARMRMHEAVDPHVVDFYLGEGYFGWIVPENKTICRVGIAAPNTSRTYFDALARRRKGKILEWQSGMIPVYDPFVETEKDGVFLVGDAATMVKATTYGGIIPGMMASEEMCEAFVDGRSYQRLWKKRIGKELYLHLLMRKMMDRMKDQHFDSMVSLASSTRIKRLLGEHDREFPSKIMMKMALLEPRLAWLGLKHMLPF